MVPDSEGTIEDTPDLHGFVVLGKKTIFLSHLPMFGMTNHRYQLILQAGLPLYAAEEYATERENNPGQTYILGNVPSDLMTIPQLCSGGTGSFVADIFRGAPQDPAKDVPFIHNVRVTVERVVHYAPFDFGENYPTTLTYLLFGAGNEAHLAHLLTKEPDFDHVLDVEAPSWLPPGKLESGVHVNFPALKSQPAYCQNPFTAPAGEVQCNGMGPLLPIRFGATTWFDTGGLNTQDPCRAAS